MPLSTLSGLTGGATGVIPGTLFRGGVHVIGVKEVQVALTLFASRAVKNVVLAGTRGAQLIEREAVELVSSGALRAVDTGLMRASTKAFMPEEVSFLHWRWKIGVHPGYTAPGKWVDKYGRRRTTPFYVLYVHEGRAEPPMAPRPYIRTAMINKQQQVQAEIGAAVAAAMRASGTVGAAGAAGR